MSININKLDFKYPNNQIFSNISLSFNEKKLHGILGPNGCGKTTLLKTILKLLKVKNDSIFINNEDINTLSRDNLAKEIAYVEQSSKQIPNISVIEYINLARYLYSDFNKQNNPIINKVIELLKINNLKNKNLTQLSGGELQKVVIARALAQETKIILLDEPTANLDPLHQIEIMNLLKDLVNKKDLTIITTLHDINLSLQYCDEIVLIKNNIITQGLTNEVINKENIKKYFNLNSQFINNPLTNTPFVLLNQENI
ncbi:MAG: ABC transporter ATP-binding protein [Pleomorphochaeta sp.]